MKRGVTRDDARRELVLGFATLAIAAGYYLSAARIPQSGISDVIGPQGLPKAYAGVLALLSLIVIGRSAVAHRTALDRAPEPRSEERELPPHVPLRTAGMLVVGALYIALVPWLGYMLSIAGLIASTVFLQGGRIDRRTGAVAGGGAFLLWLLFVRVLHIPHPAGIWPSIF